MTIFLSRKEKVLAIIARKIDDQIRFLALRNNPADPAHGGDFFYVVTGKVEEGEDQKQAILREIEEETGITKILQIIQLPIVREFLDTWGNPCREVVYLVLTDQDVIGFSIEHIGREWWGRGEFIKKIFWYGPTEELSAILDNTEMMDGV